MRSIRVSRAPVLLLPLALGCATLGCATGRGSLPYCGPPASLPPEAPAQCRAREDVRTFAGGLFELIRRDAGPLLIRVAFDERSGVRSACAERAAVEDAWQARLAVSERLPELVSLPAGPACLANTRLDFNALGAERAEVYRLVEECEFVARQRLEADRAAQGYSSLVVRSATREARICLDRHQVDRHEVWFFDPERGPFTVFGETELSSSRRAALIECSELPPPVSGTPGEPLDVLIGFAHRNARLVACMQSLGWRLLH